MLVNLKEILKIAEEKASVIKEAALEKSRNADIEAKNKVFELRQEAEKDGRKVLSSEGSDCRTDSFYG